MVIKRIIPIIAIGFVIAAFAIVPYFAPLSTGHMVVDSKLMDHSNSPVSPSDSENNVMLFTSPNCSVCNQVHPLAVSAAAKYGVNLVVYDVSTSEGKGIAQANSVSGTPTIIISGAQSARFEGAVTQAQIETAIKAAIGTATPSPSVSPTPSPSVSPTPSPSPATRTSECTLKTTGFLWVQPLTCYSPPMQLTGGSSSLQKCLVLTSSAPMLTVPSAAAASASTMLAEASALSQGSVPSVSLPTAQTSDATKLPTQSIVEFSLLGFGAPTLLIGVLYLLLRKV